RIYRLADGSRWVWRSRRHRRRLPEPKPGEQIPWATLVLESLWMPWHLSWWIGVVFAVGSSLFAFGSALCLQPALARAWSFDASEINATFFIGSIPFTTAAYLQLFQAANAGDPARPGDRTSRHRLWLGWRPHDIGWLSCALQFAGTLLFNINTLDAMQPGTDWLQQDFGVWIPDLVGSMLFLASGYLAFAETCHRYWAWEPKSISWWVTLVNLWGCVAFMASALIAFVPPDSQGPPLASVVFTLAGAICFLFGSLLMLPETAVPSVA
ncbi:MAG: hypothetical protein PVI24_15780, partial [Myxococcales bacterium]